jgi:hypothetical protein
MKKVGCAKCGGTMNKMAKGGSTTNKLNNPKGYAPAQKGGDNTKMGIYGVPNAGRTDSLGFKKGGSVKMKTGGVAKAKFGASVPVQHSPAPGRVRSASGVGTVPVGKRKMGGPVKKLVKAQAGISKGTPFQQYMKIPGAVASDTTMQTVNPSMEKLSGPGVWNAPKKPVAKNSKNQTTLENAFNQTYGEGYRNETGQPAKGETMEQYKRRMGPMKKGGAVKKYAKGGSLKPVPSNKVNSLGKLPTAVRNKMGFQKKGGTVKKK